MRRMGALQEYLPDHLRHDGIGTLAIAGISPVIPGSSARTNPVPRVRGQQGRLGARRLITALMTAFYMFRLMEMTFSARTAARCGRTHGGGA
jgi:NADH:ubiquinone oxidoreductase subunit 5 (subunit L)/multisubunit Na+/H+ antiporter MnhA subunit